MRPRGLPALRLSGVYASLLGCDHLSPRRREQLFGLSGRNRSSDPETLKNVTVHRSQCGGLLPVFHALRNDAMAQIVCKADDALEDEVASWILAHPLHQGSIQFQIVHRQPVKRTNEE
jgi:hypothetical protein